MNTGISYTGQTQFNQLETILSEYTIAVGKLPTGNHPVSSGKTCLFKADLTIVTVFFSTGATIRGAPVLNNTFIMVKSAETAHFFHLIGRHLRQVRFDCIIFTFSDPFTARSVFIYVAIPSIPSSHQ